MKEINFIEMQQSEHERQKVLFEKHIEYLNKFELTEEEKYIYRISLSQPESFDNDQDRIKFLENFEFYPKDFQEEVIGRIKQKAINKIQPFISIEQTEITTGGNESSTILDWEKLDLEALGERMLRSVDMKEMTSRVASVLIGIASVWKKFKKMPKRFEEVIILFSVSKIFEEAILEWKVTEYMVNGYYYSKSCICSHDIQEQCYAHNKYTNISLVVGNHCVEKFGTEDMKNALKLATYRGSNKPCLHCGNHRIIRHNKLYCGPCVIQSHSYPSSFVSDYYSTKKCLRCDNQIVNIDHLSVCTECWTTSDGCFVCGSSNNDNEIRCLDCYKEKVSMKCRKVLCFNIIDGHESHKTICDSCRPKIISSPVPILPETMISPETKQHSNNYNVNRPLTPIRVCSNIKCNQTIPKDSPHYYKLCISCYRNKQNSCKIIGCDNLIPKGRPNFRYCNSCYFNNR